MDTSTWGTTQPLVCVRGERLTFGDHPFQANDVLVGELAHDAGLAQEVLPLLLRVAGLQGLDGYGHVAPAGRLHHPAKHLPELSCKTRREGLLESTPRDLTLLVKRP